MSLVQLYFSDNRNSQAENLLRDLMKHPTVFVSKEQSTLALTQYLVRKDPNEARKLLEPLRSAPSTPCAQVAMAQINELPQQ